MRSRPSSPAPDPPVVCGQVCLQRTMTMEAQGRRALEAHALVSVTDAAGAITYVNDKFCAVSGYRRDELVGRTHAIVKSGVHPASFYASMWSVIRSGKVWQGEICNRRKDGTLYWVAATIASLVDARGEAAGYLSVRTDITAAKAAQRALRQRVRQQQVLSGLAARLLATDRAGMPAVLDVTLRATARLLGADRAYLLGLSPDGDSSFEISSWSARGLPRHPRERNQEPESTSTWLWREVVSGRTVELDDLDRLPAEASEDRRRLERMDIGSLLTVPIQSAARTLGLLGYARTTRMTSWRGRDVAFARTVAGMVGNAVARTDAESALQSRERELQRSLSLLDRVERLAAVGGWEIASSAGPMFWTPQTYRVHGLAPGVNATIRRALAGFPGDARRRLAAAARQCIAGAGAFDLELPFVPADGGSKWLRVLGSLQQSHGMAGRLIGAVQDITERKNAELAMVKAKEEAERASRAKSDFLSTMSHELRTPMNAVLGFGQLLEYELQPGSRELDHVREILRGGRHLLGLIDDVLDLSRIESGRLSASIESVDLAEVVADCLRMMRPLAERRAIRIEIRDIGCEVLRADRVRLRQVLVNLLSNAIKYNVDGGVVELHAMAAGLQRVRVSVRDSGPGIAQERQHELFQPFSRLDAAHGPIEGTGIGLAIVRRLVELMGGGVGVESRLGHGSLFWFELPSDAVAARPDPDTVMASLFGEWDGETTSKVVYVDDDPANLRLMEQILARRPDVELVTAQDPLVGLELAQEHLPDLLLLDIHMAPIDGFEFLARVRRSKALSRTRAVAVTADAMPDTVTRTLAAGFDDCLTKPFDVRRVLRIVERQLKEHGQ